MASLVAQQWNWPASAGDRRDSGSIPGLGRSPGGGNGNLLQDYCLENPMDTGPWWATGRPHRVTRSQTRLTELPNKVLGDCVLPSRHLRASITGLRLEGRLQRPRCHTGTSTALTPVLACPEGGACDPGSTDRGLLMTRRQPEPGQRHLINHLLESRQNQEI